MLHKKGVTVFPVSVFVPEFVTFCSLKPGPLNLYIICIALYVIVAGEIVIHWRVNEYFVSTHLHLLPEEKMQMLYFIMDLLGGVIYTSCVAVLI